jgi:hypothetical protein
MALAAVLVVAFAAPSFSAETTFSGSYRIRAVMDSNWEKGREEALSVGGVGVFPKGDDLYTGYFDQRFRLTITHKRSEFLKAVVSIDLAEDMWGQQRGMRANNSIGVTDGFINAAYIEAITPIGLIKAGTDGTSRYAYGLWSDSGIKGNGTNNPTIVYAIKVDRFIATLSYTKYLDFVQPVIANLAGAPSFFFQAWRGNTNVPDFSGVNSAGGRNSKYYNSDTDTYVMTAHYIGDKFKVGGIFQWILDPDAIGASLLVRGIADLGVFPGSFAGEGTWLIPGVSPLAVPGAAYWPNPSGAVGTQWGFGRLGLYGANLFVGGLYGNLKLMNDKLEVKAEVDRIFGYADLNGRGDSYNAFLNAAFGPLVGRLPNRIWVDGMSAYLDVSYDFEVAKIGVAGLYGSGEKHWLPLHQQHYNFNTTGNDDFHWGNIIVNGDWNMLGSTGLNGGPLGLGSNPENVTSVKLYWSVDPMEKLDIHGAFIWAKYTVPVGRYARYGGFGSPFVKDWNAFYGHPMNYVNPSGTASYIPAGISDQLGWEIDLGATYEIVEGLSFNSEFGVLFTGSAFDYRDPTTGERKSWGEVYRWVNTLTYEF